VIFLKDKNRFERTEQLCAVENLRLCPYKIANKTI